MMRAFDLGQHEGDPSAFILPPDPSTLILSSSSQRHRFLTRPLSAGAILGSFPGGFLQILTQVFIRNYVAHLTVCFVFHVFLRPTDHSGLGRGNKWRAGSDSPPAP